MINLNDILPDDSASTNVQVSAHQRQPTFTRSLIWYVPDLGVTHQSLLETNSQSVGLELDKVVFVPDGVHVFGLSVEDGVSLFDVGKSPSVVDA